MGELSLTKVHEWARVPGSMQLQLVRERNYVRLRSEHSLAPLYIQEGEVFPDGGPAIPRDELPAWFWKALEGVSPEQLLAVKWHGPTQHPHPTGGGPGGPSAEDLLDDELDAELDRQGASLPSGATISTGALPQEGSPPRTPSGRFAPRQG